MRILYCGLGRAGRECLLQLLSTQRDDERRRATLTTLVRLYHREAPYKGDWWGTRPDTSGPYYDRARWEMSEAIASVIRTVLKEDDELTSKTRPSG